MKNPTQVLVDAYYCSAPIQTHLQAASASSSLSETSTCEYRCLSNNTITYITNRKQKQIPKVATKPLSAAQYFKHAISFIQKVTNKSKILGGMMGFKIKLESYLVEM